MPFETNLSGSPYWDDFDPEKDFYRILYKPGLGVQTRELNQERSITQRQIELFADNIITKGSVVDGCNFGFHSPYRYAKIRDTEINGSVVTPLNWIGYFATSEATGLTATIVNAAEGFESSSDTNTLYLKYTNSGTDMAQSVFQQNQILKISTPSRGISTIEITNGGVGFSNSDSVVVSPAFVVTMSVGTITEGSYIQTNGGANVEVVSVDSTTLATQGKLIVRTVPRDDDLIETDPDATNWTINEGDEITNVGATIAGSVDSIIGSGLQAFITTSATGIITNLTIGSTGREYTHTPTIRVISEDNSAGLSALDLTAQNYVARCRIINRVDAVGEGYAFSVTEGVTYFRGAFLRVSPQTIIVSRYTTTPDDIAVGFSATEEIITSDIDTSLLDNAQGSPNEVAPGADRLRVRPVLELRTIADAQADDTFFSLVEFSEGRPYKQQQLTNYSKIGDHIAEVTHDHAGDYVLDQFNVTTRSPSNTSNEGQFYSVVVDPGTAYIKGRKVHTLANYVLDLNKGTDTYNDTNRRVSLNYGNYIRVNGYAGTVDFSSAKRINFYTSTKSYYSGGFAITAPSGVSIGSARVRHVALESGTPGTSSAIYRLYLFDINMNSGTQFTQARSVFAPDAPYAVGDIVTELDGTTGLQIAAIKETDKNKFLFFTGSESPKSINSITYTYRTVNATAVKFASNGTASFDISSFTDELFPWVGELSDTIERTIYVVPNDNMIGNTPITGTITTNGSNVITGSGSSFLSALEAGDYIYVGANSTGGFEYNQITSVTNNTHLRVRSAVSFSNAATEVVRAFPNNVPIPFGSRTGLSINVASGSQVMALHLGLVLDQVGTANATISVDIERNEVAHTSKTIRRNHYVKLNLNTHDNGINGPWCLGVPDVFRLRGVWIGDSNVDEDDQEITGDFFIDHNQNANFLNHSFLYRVNGAKRVLTTSDYLLVKFDYFVGSAGVFDILSYTHSSNATEIFATDSLDVEELDADAHTLEIPDVLDARGNRYDLKSQFDFRPSVSNTVTTASVIGSAPTNPSYTVDIADIDYKFPTPDSILECEIECWKGRIDNILINKDGKVYAMKGEPGRSPIVHSGSMLLNTLVVPSYPGIPVEPSDQLLEILATRVGNERISTYNIETHLLKPTMSDRLVESFYQPEKKSMRDIGALERRIEAIEYYLTQTVLESSIADKNIPSSIDPSVNRFKYGFFVDECNDDLYSDTTDSQYSVEMISSRMYPTAIRLPVVGYDEAITFPYDHHKIVAQGFATDSGIAPNCVPNTSYAVVTTFKREANTLQIGNTSSSFIEKQENLIFANSAAPAVLYFAVGGSSTKIEIYQNNVLVRTSNDAVSLTTADINKLKANTIPGNFFTSSNLAISVDKIGNNYVRNAGKISWTHDASAGRTYEVRTYKGAGGRDWKYMFEYPVDASSVGCVIELPDDPTDPQPNTPPPTPPIYAGTMIMSPNTLNYTRYVEYYFQDSANAGND